MLEKHLLPLYTLIKTIRDMSLYFTFALTVFTGFFAILNPIVGIPVFLDLVKDESASSQKEIAKKACLIAFIILTAFLLLGKYIFSFFGITIPSFKITGGILIFYVGFEMLLSKKSQVKRIGKNPEIADDVAVSPLAIPMLSGPGTIVTGMNFVANSDLIELVIVVLLGAIVLVLNYYSFLFSKIIIRVIGRNKIIVLGKIMGLILAVMGTNMLIQGIKLAFGI